MFSILRRPRNQLQSRGAPVLGRSDVEVERSLGKWDRVGRVEACCARGRAHSAVVYPAALAVIQSEPGWAGELFRNDPDVAIINWMAVVLQPNGTTDGCFGVEAGGGGSAVDLNLIMDEHAVVFDGHQSIFYFRAGLIELCRIEIHVVGLPGERGQTHVDFGLGERVEAAALVVFARQPERIEERD